MSWTYIIIDINGEEIVRTFHEKELQRTNQIEFKIEKWLKENGIDYMLNGKVMIIRLIVGLLKKI